MLTRSRPLPFSPFLQTAVPISFYVIEELKLDAAATNIAQQMIQLPQAFQVRT